MNIKTVTAQKDILNKVKWNSSGIGIASTISISKTIKIIPRRKNRSENGIRAEFFGSNPHSNGDNFSRSFCDRIFRNHAVPAVITLSVKATVTKVNEIVIS